MASDNGKCQLISSGECDFCNRNLSPWLSMIDAERPEATGGSPDKPGVYVYASDIDERGKNDSRKVIFMGRANNSIRANILEDMGGRESKLRQFVQDNMDAIWVRFAVNDDDSGCSESDMVCNHWETGGQLPRFNRQWPRPDGANNDCT